MKIFKSASLAALVTFQLLNTASALADDPVVQIGNPSYQGTGCPDGTVSATLSPDATALSLIFDKYTVEAGRSASGLMQDRKQCSFQVPMTIPAGYSVSIVQIDYRGFHSLPQGATASFMARYGFRDRRFDRPGRDLGQVFQGPVEGDFFVTQTAGGPAPGRPGGPFGNWSECDGEVQMRLDTALGVQSNPAGELAMASIDSADMTGASRMQYLLAWRKCNGPEIHPGQPGHPVGRGRPWVGPGPGSNPGGRGWGRGGRGRGQPEPGRPFPGGRGPVRPGR